MSNQELEIQYYVVKQTFGIEKNNVNNPYQQFAYPIIELIPQRRDVQSNCHSKKQNISQSKKILKELKQLAKKIIRNNEEEVTNHQINQIRKQQQALSLEYLENLEKQIEKVNKLTRKIMRKANDIFESDQ